MLLERKAKNILVLEIESSICDRMIVATATSNRQSSALVDYLIERAKKASIPVSGTEGTNDFQWVLVDLGDIVVHIMLPETRDFYQLEKFWQPIAHHSFLVQDTPASA